MSRHGRWRFLGAASERIHGDDAWDERSVKMLASAVDIRGISPAGGVA